MGFSGIKLTEFGSFITRKIRLNAKLDRFVGKASVHCRW